MAIARDKFWIFGVRAHQDDIYLGRYKADTWSRITPAEAAFMLDVPNLMLINCDGIPVPFSCDAYGYAESFIALDKVYWSATGSAGFRLGIEEKFICDLAEKYPNVCGTMLDDLFHPFKDDPRANEKVIAILDEVRTGLNKACRPMDLYMVWYTHQIDSPHIDVLNHVDGFSIWTSDYTKLTELEKNFEILERKFPNKKKMLGIYMYSFLEGKPIPNEYMEIQCELGLRLMKEGRLDGMIFEDNAVMGIGLPSELWLRDWIKKVKNTPIPD